MNLQDIATAARQKSPETRNFRVGILPTGVIQVINERNELVIEHRVVEVSNGSFHPFQVQKLVDDAKLLAQNLTVGAEVI